MTSEELAHIAGANGLPLPVEQLALIERYAVLLRAKNQTVNLISRKDEDNILEKHILHSLTLAMPSVADFLIPRQARVFDLGTGGGLPGIPLKIVRADLSVVLCDSIAKKITAVGEFIDTLGLQQAQAITCRAEDAARTPEHRKQYDIIVTRAVAPLDELIVWAQDLMKKGATLLSLKGGDLRTEIAAAGKIKNVAAVTERILDLKDYPGFRSDEKKVIRVLLR